MFHFFVHGELTKDFALLSEEESLRQALEEGGLLEKRETLTREISQLEETKPLFKDQILAFVHRFTKFLYLKRRLVVYKELYIYC